MDVGVAILAALPDIGEHGLDVTFSAGHGRVQASQGILRLVMVEFRDGADRPPGVGGVAILARDVQVSVRTVRNARGLRVN